MKLKSTPELRAIWNKDDHQEWTDEAFVVVERLLIERLGELPEKRPGKIKEPEKEKTELSNLSLLMLTPIPILIVVTLLVLWLKSTPNDDWHGIIQWLFPLAFIAQGILMGWKFWLKEDTTRKEIVENWPKFKEGYGWPYYYLRSFTHGTPDRNIPTSFLLRGKVLSIGFIILGIYFLICLHDI